MQLSDRLQTEEEKNKGVPLDVEPLVNKRLLQLRFGKRAMTRSTCSTEGRTIGPSSRASRCGWAGRSAATLQPGAAA